ncbi:TRAM domain-containing protein [Tepidanaerobacter acetatoxydans]|nr:TRAM domain-containing protein [Tepidanaerobacter acetatoxydans]AEE91042.1 hypothetical protein TepRe1_0867 [Tepidanaerobacter acetatoxydans Re1]
MKNKIKAALQLNGRYEVQIEKMAHEGQGIGKIDGLTVFVEGAVPVFRL